MKRYEINKALKELEAICEKLHCYLPPFCHFTPEQWQEKGHEYDEIRDCCLGWDITDYGMGDFDKVGFSLITIRNGSRKEPDKYPKVYAEKLLYLKERPWLLPAAWASRMGSYCRDSLMAKPSSAAESLKLGAQRTELLKYYGILSGK